MKLTYIIITMMILSFLEDIVSYNPNSHLQRRKSIGLKDSTYVMGKENNKFCLKQERG